VPREERNPYQLCRLAARTPSSHLVPPRAKLNVITMGDITIEKDTFHDRLSSFISHWKSDKRAADGLFNGANSIIVPIGKANESSDNYSKTAAFQLWLLGYEFPATIITLTTDGITFVTTKKKAIYLEPLKGGKVAVDVLVRGKDAEANKALFTKCVDIVKAAGSKVGVIAGEPQAGPFIDEWKPVHEELISAVEEVDITAALSSTALAVKDEKELVCAAPQFVAGANRPSEPSVMRLVLRATFLEPNWSAKSPRLSMTVKRLAMINWLRKWLAWLTTTSSSSRPRFRATSTPAVLIGPSRPSFKAAAVTI
jgi:hypothetical protein